MCEGYLSCRPYMEFIVRSIIPMLESGLPCFKENTIKNLRQRFVPTKSERKQHYTLEIDQEIDGKFLH